MSRDDSILNTGLSSALYRRQVEANKQRQDVKQKEATKLKPHADIIQEEIKAVRAEIAEELGNIIHIDMKATDIKATVLGLKLADRKILSLETRLKNKLRAEDRA